MTDEKRTVPVEVAVDPEVWERAVDRAGGAADVDTIVEHLLDLLAFEYRFRIVDLTVETDGYAEAVEQ